MGDEGAGGIPIGWWDEGWLDCKMGGAMAWLPVEASSCLGGPEEEAEVGC